MRRVVGACSGATPGSAGSGRTTCTRSPPTWREPSRWWGKEDLAVGGMLKSRRFGGSLADQSFGMLRRQLEYKCQASGAKLLVAPRFFPSSRRCSGCGAIRAQLALEERTFRCEDPECGLVLDRDHNAALNLRWWGEQTTTTEVAAGRAETENACGARVRPGRGHRGGASGLAPGCEAGTEHRDIGDGEVSG